MENRSDYVEMIILKAQKEGKVCIVVLRVHCYCSKLHELHVMYHEICVIKNEVREMKSETHPPSIIVTYNVDERLEKYAHSYFDVFEG